MLLGLGIIPAVAAQQPPPELSGVFAEVLDVRVVNVEAVVTDRKGNRIEGLSAGDFRLLVDGEEVDIEYFSEVADGAVRTEHTASDEAQRPPAIPEGDRVGTNYLVFVDDQFSLARDRNRVLDSIEEQLGHLAEFDRLAMVAFDGSRLSLVTDWTGNETTLDYAFRSARGRPAYGDQRLSELSTNDNERRQRAALETTNAFFQAQISDAVAEEQQDEDFSTRLDPVERYYAYRLEDQLSRSVSAAVASLRAFAGPSGRKVAVLLSGGWPFHPALYAMASNEAGSDQALMAATEGQVKRGSQIFGPLVDTANLLGFTLYPVDVPGLARRTIDDTLGAPDPLSGEPVAVGDGLARDLQQQDSLEYLAHETGGEAFINSARDLAFTKTIEDTRSYYWLGFSPSRNEDDEAHDVRIELRDRSLRVRSRRSFLDFSRQAEQTMIVEAAAFFGEAPSKISLELRFGEPQKAGRGRVSLPLEIGIPMEQITMIPASGLLVSNLEYRVTVMDENGARSQTPMQEIQIVGEEPPQPGQLHWHETSLTMRKRRHRVIVAITDPLSGTLLSSTQIVDP